MGEGVRVWTRVWARACECGRGRASVGEGVRVWTRACECGRGRVSVGEGV